CEPDLDIDKEPEDGEIISGGSSSWTVTITNNGNAPTTVPVFVLDTLPDDLTNVEVSGTGWTCDPESIPGPTNNDTLECTYNGDPLGPGDSAFFTVTYTAPLACDPITNTAELVESFELALFQVELAQIGDTNNTDVATTTVVGCEPGLTSDAG